MKIKPLLVIIILCIVNLLNGCSKTKDTYNMRFNDISGAAITFDNAISISDYIIEAKFVKFYKKGLYVEHEFEVKKVLYGEVSESDIFLYTYLPDPNKDVINIKDEDYLKQENKYHINEDYILMTKKSSSIFYEHDKYSLVTDIILPVHNLAESKMYGQPLITVVNKGKKVNLDKYITITKKGHNKNKEKNKLENKKTPEILKTAVAAADLILEVKITSLSIEGQIQNSNTYTCKPIQKLKGKNYMKSGDGTILDTLVKDSVKVGDKYILMLNMVNDNSLIYYQSSKYGVIPITDKGTVSELKAYLKKFSP